MRGNSSPSATRYEINDLQSKIGKTKIQIPSVLIEDYTYTGEAQGPTILGLDEIHTNVINTIRVNAGTSILTIALTDPTIQEWTDGTIADKTYPYTISPAPTTITVSDTLIDLNNNDLSKQITVTTNSDTTMYVYSDNQSVATVSEYDFVTNTFYITGIATGTATIHVDAGATASYEYAEATITVNVDIIGDLDSTSWERISELSAAGMASSYWQIGDAKKIHVQGKIGYSDSRHIDNLVLNDDLYVFIMEFDHNAAIEGYGISFGTFKTSKTSTDVVGLVDKYYMTWVWDEGEGDGYIPEDYHAFSMYHDAEPSGWGGWKGTDLRYDILGSTNVAPSGYGNTHTETRVGYDATPTTTTTPVSNTLMAALPSDLRAVMKPITKYVQGDVWKSGTNLSIITSIDYLPLISGYELTKQITVGSDTAYQTQYEYYANGNNRIRYAYGATDKVATGTAVYTLIRSQSTSSAGSWYTMKPDGDFLGFGVGGNKVLSISAVFLV